MWPAGRTLCTTAIHRLCQTNTFSLSDTFYSSLKLFYLAVPGSAVKIVIQTLTLLVSRLGTSTAQHGAYASVGSLFWTNFRCDSLDGANWVNFIVFIHCLKTFPLSQGLHIRVLLIRLCFKRRFRSC